MSMEGKNHTDVLIDGRIYSFSGDEDEQYLQKIASYITAKTAQLKRQEGFSRQSQEYQAVMVEFNIADDYFQALDKAEASDRRRDGMERETYSLKHELVTVQMALERKEQELSDAMKQLSAAQAETEAVRARLGEQVNAVRAENETDRAELLEQLSAAQAETEAVRARLGEQVKEAQAEIELLKQQHKDERDELLKLRALKAAYARA